jgi:hypothetical protein
MLALLKYLLLGIFALFLLFLVTLIRRDMD